MCLICCDTYCVSLDPDLTLAQVYKFSLSSDLCRIFPFSARLFQVIQFNITRQIKKKKLSRFSPNIFDDNCFAIQKCHFLARKCLFPKTPMYENEKKGGAHFFIFSKQDKSTLHATFTQITNRCRRKKITFAYANFQRCHCFITTNEALINI